MTPCESRVTVSANSPSGERRYRSTRGALCPFRSSVGGIASRVRLSAADSVTEPGMMPGPGMMPLYHWPPSMCAQSVPVPSPEQSNWTSCRWLGPP
ncbi:MAG TPA: hypothetical protein VF482_05170 [Trebonia sp.]